MRGDEGGGEEGGGGGRGEEGAQPVECAPDTQHDVHVMYM